MTDNFMKLAYLTVLALVNFSLPLAAPVRRIFKLIKSAFMNNLSQSAFSLYTVVYNFRHSKMGFQNSITVEALDEAQALEIAKTEISLAFGAKMLPRFTFNKPALKPKP